METLKSVFNLVRRGDYAFSPDLADAYLHLPFFPGHREFLRFCIGKQVYQFRVIACEQKVAPQVFTEFVAVVVTYLRRQSSTYVSRRLVLSSHKAGLLQDRESLDS